MRLPSAVRQVSCPRCGAPLPRDRRYSNDTTIGGCAACGFSLRNAAAARARNIGAIQLSLVFAGANLGFGMEAWEFIAGGVLLAILLELKK